MARLLSQILGHESLKKQLLQQTKKKNFFYSAIFWGPEGIGKKLIARALLQELNCEQEEACGACEACIKIEKNADVYLHQVELQNDKIKVESIRDIIQFTSLKSWVKHRFVIINHIEKITLAAANALLKTLEEPPEGVHFILITANLSQVLPTIRSRCQVVGFSPLSEEVIQSLVSNLEPWQKRWSFGRATLAQKIGQEEWIEIRKSAINFLHSPQNKQTTDALQSYLAQPESADFVVHTWMTYLRDAFLLQSGFKNNIYNQDIESFAQKIADTKNISLLIDEVFKFRQDLMSNVDKTLLLDQLSICLESHAAKH